MMQLHQIKSFFPPYLQEQPAYAKYMLKEYIQLMMLDFLSTSPYARRLSFIGGTFLRLVKGIDRFSEDLDFDCKALTRKEFMQMTDDVLLFLQRNGLHVETRDKQSEKIKAFRRSFYFPEFLFSLGLSGYREERFLIKIEAEDQVYEYANRMVIVQGCGFYVPFPAPPDDILCAMKVSALLSRHKGRDFYDILFLWPQSKPDFGFLSARHGIHNVTELKKSLNALLKKTDLKQKSKDCEHLLFDRRKSERILRFGDFVDAL